MATEIVGRSAELGAIELFLDRLAGQPVALAFEGQPGIGKTTVWRQAVERAGRRSISVLSCRAVEAEAKLSFTALADLLERRARTPSVSPPLARGR